MEQEVRLLKVRVVEETQSESENTTQNLYTS